MTRRALALTLTLAAVTALTLAATPPWSRSAETAPALEGSEDELFESWVGKYTDLDYGGLVKHLAVPAAPADRLSFSPRRDAAYYKEVTTGLALNAAARATLEKTGVVLVDPQRTYSMAGALYEIYTSDLPLLVTSDAVLDAMHRSFDAILAELEEHALADLLADALKEARGRAVAAAKVPGMDEAARDADLYFTVALNLLESDPDTGRLGFAPLLAAPEEVLAILARISAGALEQRKETALYGGTRAVDWSQFKPRGHYSKSEELERYFRAMMWLGRADTGFELEQTRQLRAASLVSLALTEGAGGKKLAAVKEMIGLIVGRSDDLAPEQLAGILRESKLGTPASLAGDAEMTRLNDLLDGSGLGRQRIRSELVVSDPNDPRKVSPPGKLQVFGQGFVLDSFVLSKVVYDDIIYKGKKQERRMPTGLDVMAALGSDEAVRLLEPELRRWHYGANLAALRDVVDSWSPARWDESLYSVWLGALRSLSDVPAGAHVPEVMKTRAWERKTLQTQLASWAQLRHDTILYAKQSFSASAGCVYPMAYVEPYPVLYGQLERFAIAASGALGALRSVAGAGGDELLAGYTAYFDNFARTMKKLRVLSEKELAGVPFTAEELGWLKRTVDQTAGGDGYGARPVWDGWYFALVYVPSDEGPEYALEYDPTIADVHTDPDNARVLEVGTGGVDLAVVAIDNAGDRAVYVGPSFRYYEFTHPAEDRLTDEVWAEMLWDREASPPARPAWIQPYTAVTTMP